MADKKYTELDPLVHLSNAQLLAVADPANGKLYQITLQQLRDFLGIGLVKLSTPVISITDIDSTSFKVALVSDTHAVNHMIRVATDAQFSNTVRSVNVTTNPATISSLTPNTVYYVGVIDTAAGYANSNEANATTTTLAVNANQGFPYTFPIIF